MKHLWVLTNKDDMDDVTSYTDKELLKEANSWFEFDCKTVQEALELFCDDFYIGEDFVEDVE